MGIEVGRQGGGSGGEKENLLSKQTEDFIHDLAELAANRGHMSDANIWVTALKSPFLVMPELHKLLGPCHQAQKGNWIQTTTEIPEQEEMLPHATVKKEQKFLSIIL